MESAPVLTVKAQSGCPWGPVPTAETVSLNDVMSEQLAHSLAEEEKTPPEAPIFVEEVVVEKDDCCDDLLLAQMMQLDFDKEHDHNLKREESKYNGESKVKISYGKFRRLASPDQSSSEDEEEREYQLDKSAREHWRNFEQAEKNFQAVGRSGVARQNNVTTTKHDPTLCGRRNAGRMMEFPPNISTGDGGKFDMRLSNGVYNAFRRQSIHLHKKGRRVHDKREIATVEKALDEKTNLILYKMVNNQTLDSLSGCISTGKEACVFHAWSGLPAEESPSPEFAIKVFKTTLNEFQNRDAYIKDDHRFRNRFSKQNPRKVIHMWAEKEMRNLYRMRDAGLPCPTVVCLKKHVLVMSFIGQDMLPAPKIKEVQLPFEDWTLMYEQVAEIVRCMYSKCRLVHADLSEYNLLWHNQQAWVIDVSQAVETTHPQAADFLLRDCQNVTTFFSKKGVLNVPSPEDLFFEVCGEFPRKPLEEPPL